MVYNVNLLFLKIMEEKKMNEMESLETITKMLQATKGEDMRSIVIRFRAVSYTHLTLPTTPYV